MDLLTTKDEALALSMAYEIESLNRERAELQNKIWDEVRVQVEVGIQQGLYRHGILIGHRDWHEGVVGIVASRVTETFKKPAAVISIREDLAKGSVRSYGGKDVLEALRECSSLLKNFGGHKFAAGCAFLPQNYSLMVEAFDQAVEKLKSDSSHQLNIDYHCEVHELNHRVLEELEKLGPYGPGHPEPVFAVRAQGSQVKVLKERHLKFQLSRQVEAVWFNAAENNDWKELKLLEQTCHWAGVPELNRFAGRVTPTLRIRDYHLLENETT
jgi:single-stranded-DNA-specific exonuclease